MNELELEKIEAVKRILISKFKGSSKESQFISFEELAKEPELRDQMGVKKIFAFVEKISNEAITFEVITKRVEMPSRAGQEGAYPQLSNPIPVGIQVHVFNPEKIESYFKFDYPIKLSDHKVIFDDQKSTISANSRVTQIPPFKNEYYLCKVLFDKPVGTPIDWSLLHKEIEGTDPLNDGSAKETKAQQRKIRDTMDAINERVIKDINTTDKLFTWLSKSVKRNF
jgi:hypothetical protein